MALLLQHQFIAQASDRGIIYSESGSDTRTAHHPQFHQQCNLISSAPSSHHDFYGANLPDTSSYFDPNPGPDLRPAESLLPLKEEEKGFSDIALDLNNPPTSANTTSLDTYPYLPPQPDFSVTGPPRSTDEDLLSWKLREQLVEAGYGITVDDSQRQSTAGWGNYHADAIPSVGLASREKGGLDDFASGTAELNCENVHYEPHPLQSSTTAFDLNTQESLPVLDPSSTSTTANGSSQSDPILCRPSEIAAATNNSTACHPPPAVTKYNCAQCSYTSTSLYHIHYCSKFEGYTHPAKRYERPILPKPQENGLSCANLSETTYSGHLVPKESTCSCINHSKTIGPGHQVGNTASLEGPKHSDIPIKTEIYDIDDWIDPNMWNENDVQTPPHNSPLGGLDAPNVPTEPRLTERQRGRKPLASLCDRRKNSNCTRYCPEPGCPCSEQSGYRGFLTRDDATRHAASHQPCQIKCSYCPREFRRSDNYRA